MPLTNFSNQLYVTGLLAEIPVGGSTVTVEKTFAFGTKVAGAALFLSDCKYGDYGEFFLVHPQAGVVGQFAETAYLPEGAREVKIDVPEGGTEVPAGLTFRFTMTAIDALGRKIIVWLMVRK